MKKSRPCTTRRIHTYASIFILGCSIQTNSYAQDTTSATVTFRSGSPQSVTVERIGDVAVVQGDMIVGYANEVFSSRKQTRGLSNTVYGAIWPNGIVPYVIDAELSRAAEGRIRDAIEHWNDVDAVNLIERTSSNAGSFPNYIHFIDEDQCASWVGFQNTGPQSIYSGDTCSTGSMIHEIGHALGLLHEHTRPDRDNFVLVNWSDIIAGKEHNFEILSDGVPLGDYDYDSIMHYGERFFSKNGASTLKPITPTSTTLGQREAASAGDKESIATLYQTNLALVGQSDTQNVQAGRELAMSFFVTNQSDVGANTLQIDLAVPQNTSLLSYSSNQWLCIQTAAGANVTCRSTVLHGSADSTVKLALQAPDTIGVATLKASLISLTDDVDISNNTDSVSFNVVASNEDSQPAVDNVQSLVAEVPAASTPNSDQSSIDNSPLDNSSLELAPAQSASNFAASAANAAAPDAPTSSASAAKAAVPNALASEGGSGGGGSIDLLAQAYLLLAIFFLCICRICVSQRRGIQWRGLPSMRHVSST